MRGCLIGLTNWRRLSKKTYPCFPLFVVLACLAVVSSDDYQTHRHSSHNPICLTDTGLPVRKVESRQVRRRRMPVHSALVVSREKNVSAPLGWNTLDFLVVPLNICFDLQANSTWVFFFWGILNVNDDMFMWSMNQYVTVFVFYFQTCKTET